MALYLVRYGELGLKSRGVRHLFEKALRNNIMARFISAEKECRIEHERGRIYIWSDHEDFTTHVLAHTFGIVSFSKAEETDSSMESINGLASRVSKPLFREGMSFAVRARRSGQHDYTSMDLARETGSAIFISNQHLNPKVDLTDPELEIFIEVRQKRAFVYTERLPGPGGMPLGTQGKVLGIVEGPSDMAACWLIMKRGCRVIIASANPEQAAPLREWDPGLKTIEPQGSLTQMAHRLGARGLVVGWNISEFDESQSELDGTDIPVFYPLIGMAGAEIGKIMAQICH